MDSPMFSFQSSFRGVGSVSDWHFMSGILWRTDQIPRTETRPPKLETSLVWIETGNNFPLNLALSFFGLFVYQESLWGCYPSSPRHPSLVICQCFVCVVMWKEHASDGEYAGTLPHPSFSNRFLHGWDVCITHVTLSCPMKTKKGWYQRWHQAKIHFGRRSELLRRRSCRQEVKSMACILDSEVSISLSLSFLVIGTHCMCGMLLLWGHFLLV